MQWLKLTGIGGQAVYVNMALARRMLRNTGDDGQKYSEIKFGEGSHDSVNVREPPETIMELLTKGISL